MTDAGSSAAVATAWSRSSRDDWDDETTALYDLFFFQLPRPLPSCVFSSVFSPRYDLMNRISDRPDQFFSSICNGVSSCLACGTTTLLCGSCIPLHVLLIPILIICRACDDSLAYVSNPCFRRILAYLPSNLVHALVPYWNLFLPFSGRIRNF